MYQRKEKSDNLFPGCQEGIMDLFRLLESSNPEEVDSVKNLIHENLSSAKDSTLLNCIVDYYLSLYSGKALDVLAGVKDPHDKHLFDKINELLKSSSSRYSALQLLCNLVYRQPYWVHRLANHRLMNSLFQILKTDVQAPNLISALLVVVCLLPMIPSQFGPYLNDTFGVFSRLIAWNVKKPSSMPETFVLHLQLGVYSLFHRLYGMFPCNFLAYLRSYYGGRDYNEENNKVFTSCIKPMLECVRLHPLLVTASKETELSANRWKKMEYHDVITVCASISLDALEGTPNGLRGCNQNLNTAPRRQSSLCAQNSIQYVSLSSQSSVKSTTVEPIDLVTESISSHRESLWSPCHAYGPESTSFSSNVMAFSLVKRADPETVMQAEVDPLPLDVALEVKAEEPETVETKSLSHAGLKTSSKDVKVAVSESVKDQRKEDSKADAKKVIEQSFSGSQDSSFEKNILEAVEAREEEIDKEVSDITSNKSNESSPCDVRHDTPFCSTTQNLTDEPADFVVCSAPTSESAESQTKNPEDDVDELYNSLQDEPYIQTFTRLRYISHCGPSIFPAGGAQVKIARSKSCPDKFCFSRSSPVDDSIPDVVTTSVVATCSNSAITTTCSFATVNTELISSASRALNYEQLLPMALDPLPDASQPLSTSLESNYHSYDSLITTLSPPELLDNYIKQGSETYLSSIPITSTKSTDWTHFGGKPPPDEVDILRKQIQLLYNQLLFERHRKDVHSERIRRILGRAKKARMQEELVVALKEQINLLVTDNEKLELELSKTCKEFDRFKLEKAEVEKELNNAVVKIKQENALLVIANQKLQKVATTQKEENDKFLRSCKAYRETIINLETELMLCQEELNSCRKLRKESVFLSKQLFLLQEINDLYKEKIEKLKEPSESDIGAELMNSAALVEIKDLKTKLEYTCIQLDTANCKIKGLDKIISVMKQNQKEHHQRMEDLRAVYQGEINTCQENLSEYKRMILAKDSDILKLHKEQETLTERIKVAEKKLTRAVEPQPERASDSETLVPTWSSTSKKS